MLIPKLALFGKLVFSSFFITLIISLNQLIHFPEDNYIYGYIASIVCMINIFVFSSLDFSLCILFLAVYCISFAINHVRHPLSQIAGILLIFVPFVPYLLALLSGGTETLGPLYAGTNFWNIRMSLFAMPFQLMVSRLMLTLGIFGRKHQFYLPVNLVLVFIAGVAFSGVLLFIPAWSDKEPLEVSIRQTIDSWGGRLEVKAPVELQNLRIESNRSTDALTETAAESADFLRIRSSSRVFLERQLVEISIEPSIPVQKIEVRIKSENGLSVYSASLPFVLLGAGAESLFTPGENPEFPFAIHFSSDLSSKLTAVVRVWTRTNPFGLIIRNKDLTTDYLLEIARTVEIGKQDGNGE